jgi:hypothetical protein
MSPNTLLSFVNGRGKRLGTRSTTHPQPPPLPQIDSESSDDESEEEQGDIDGSEVPVLEKPSEKVYRACLFDIKWHKLRYNGEPFPGKIGWRIRSNKASNRASKIFRHGAELIWLYLGQKKKVWLCKLCHLNEHYHQGVYLINGYESIFRHLRNAHQIFYNEKKKRVKLKNSQTRLGGRSWAQATSFVQAERRPFDVDGFLRATVDWSILEDLSYRQVTSKHTRNYLAFDRDQMDIALWKSHTTLSDHIQKAYNERLVDIKKLLWLAKSKIHISCDIWQSGNDHSLLAVVAHFLGKT